VYKYIQKNQVIRDLVDYQIMFVGDDGQLLKKWESKNKKEKPTIFSLFQGEGWQADAFTRWEVEIPGDLCSKTWEDLTLRGSWINYYTETKKDKTLCYVTGEKLLKTDKQPKKIRGDGDGAKLISSNDTDGFTFLGRFTSAEQACGIGFEITQKAHNALRWLISRQGKIFYVKGESGKTNPGLTIVAWATSGAKIPDPFADTLGLFDDEDMRSEITGAGSTAQHLANNLTRLMAGYNAKIGSTDGIVVMGMDSATPGRMSITFCRELTGSEFLARVQGWHESCAWWQDYGKDKETKESIRFIGAPAPSDIAGAAYGRRIDDKLRKATVGRILPCIIDGAQLPSDIVESAVRHVCNRITMEHWEWEKSLGITCGIYKKYHIDKKERRYNMALEHDRRTRDYLFGRLLAAADGLESLSLYLANDKRDTNAARMMQRFADRPSSTWKTIELSLTPHKARLGARAGKYLKVIDEVMDAFNSDDFISDKPLSGEFLLGYHCQRKDLWPKDQATDEVLDEQEDN
jgi:CRISPR-associated protein Csd1